MPDIELRFHNDMLVLSAPIDAMLARQGIHADLDRQYLNLMEPDVIQDALNLELVAGAQCLVTTTEDITQARLAHVRMDGDARQLAKSALEVAAALKPQHLFVEIGPCGLPLDPSSKASLNENRAQYAEAARAFGHKEFDAFFLNGFTNIADLKCALMGVAQVGDAPVIASVTIGAGGGELPPETMVQLESWHDIDEDDILPMMPIGGYELVDEMAAPPIPAAKRVVLDADYWPEAVQTMADLGASVVGFETADYLDRAETYVKQAVSLSSLPVLAQMRVKAHAASDKLHKLTPLHDIHEYTPDTMELAAVRLYAAGAQFLRATGAATPAYTGVLASTVQGLDVRRY